MDRALGFMPTEQVQDLLDANQTLLEIIHTMQKKQRPEDAVAYMEVLHKSLVRLGRQADEMQAKRSTKSQLQQPSSQLQQPTSQLQQPSSQLQQPSSQPDGKK